MTLVMVDINEGIDRNRIDKGTGRKKTKSISSMRVVQRLKKRFPNLKETTLDCGDIKVIMDNGQTLAIERKRAGDFLGSVGEGRIFRQVENMAQNADWSVVIIEGLISFDADDMAVIPIYDDFDNVKENESTGWHGASIRGAMWAILFSGCPVITIEPQSLPDVVQDLINFCMKPMEHTQTLGRHRIVTFPPVPLTIEVLASFPGIGLKKAKSLAEFSKSHNENEVATLAECLCWGSSFPLLERSVRPEGWRGDKELQNFIGTLGLKTGEFLTIKEDRQQTRREETSKRGKSNGK